MAKDDYEAAVHRDEIARLQRRLELEGLRLAAMAAFVRPGMAVWYEARPGVKHAAIVDSEVRLLGNSEPVVRLRGLDEAYVKDSGRDFVAAAATWCLTPREHEPGTTFGQIARSVAGQPGDHVRVDLPLSQPVPLFADKIAPVVEVRSAEDYAALARSVAADDRYPESVTRVAKWALNSYELVRELQQLHVNDVHWSTPGLSSVQVRASIIAEVGMMAQNRTPEMQAAYDAACAREREALYSDNMDAVHEAHRILIGKRAAVLLEEIVKEVAGQPLAGRQIDMGNGVVAQHEVSLSAGLFMRIQYLLSDLAPIPSRKAGIGASRLVREFVADQKAEPPDDERQALEYCKELFASGFSAICVLLGEQSSDETRIDLLREIIHCAGSTNAKIVNVVPGGREANALQRAAIVEEMRRRGLDVPPEVAAQLVKEPS